METRAHYVLIGGAVLAAIGLAFLFVLFLAGGRSEYDEYVVIFDGNASGLSEGSAVRFNGVQKGEVKELTIDPEDPEIVRALIRVDNDTPVKTDTVAKLELAGFTGLAIIQLEGGSKGAQKLKEVGRPPQSILAQSGGLAAFLDGSGEIVARVNQLLSEENTETITNILHSLETTAAAVADNDEAIRATIQNTATFTEGLANASERLDRITLSLDKLLADDAPEAVAEAKATLSDLRVLIASLQGVVDENAEPLAIFAEQGLSQVGPTFVEARRTLRTLDQILREIDRDPRGYLLGESTPQHQGGGE
ncbi:MAG: MCE family protein [Alphaproteobacteria bacterium]|nr:MCE family protein [Alphaproteobacteria bacterium]